MAEPAPIADLSYRGYEGTRSGHSGRWLVIAKHAIRMAFHKKSYWILMVLSSLHFLVLMAVSYFIDSFSKNMGGGEEMAHRFFTRVIWRDQFLSGVQVGHLLLMSIVLLVGAGAIANDNRSNALLVYLSKPCTKRDYIVGKFFGIFVPILLALAIPAVAFYLYGAMNYREHGFLKDDPLMLPKVVAAAILAAAYQASIVLGISSLFNQGRWAGATYAGLYVLSGMFASVVTVMKLGSGATGAMAKGLDTLHYLSLYGGIEAIYKWVLQTDGSAIFSEASDVAAVPRPGAFILLVVVMIPVLLGWFLAWRKVRAVEVVG